MFSIDIRTIFLSYIIVHVVNFLFISSLFFQTKKKFPGTIFIVISFSLSLIGNILVFTRNLVPDWVSMVFGNSLVVTSTLILLIGLEKFANKKIAQFKNYFAVFLFIVVQTYFTFYEPDLNGRNINLSIIYLWFSLQISYYTLKGVPSATLQYTRPIGYVWILVFIVMVFRLAFLYFNKNAITYYFESGNTESLFIIAYEVIYILLAYSIILMFNKRLSQDLVEQEEKFSKAFHEAPFLITLSRLTDGVIFEINNYAEKILGYQHNELIGYRIIDLNIWKTKDRKKFIDDLKKYRSISEREYSFRKKSGEKFCGLISAEIININNEECIISIVRDITEKKQAESKLKKSEARLQELNSTKDKFFSIIAHDLKSPFNAILGFSELLSERIKKKEYDGLEKYADIINKSSNHTVNLLSNLMEWSRVQTGRIEFTPEYIDVNKLINSVLNSIKISAERKSIQINQNIPSTLIVYADKQMLETIFRNLISNAIKFTHENGEIVISVEEKKNEFLFSVKDSGIGIEKENLDKLFGIENSYSVPGTANEKGTGLGLILCKDFIDLHEGIIYADSEIGVGSTFYFSIPKK